MQQIFNFLIRNKNNILFLFLLALSVFFTIQTHSFHKSSFISSANSLTGGIYSWANDFDKYMHLDEYNERLMEENKQLRNVLTNLKDTIPIENYTDTSSFEGTYYFRTARVINNNYSKPNNFLTLNQGKESGIKADFGVITSKGVIGIVDRVNKRFSRVISILNSESKINAQLSKTNHFGSLIWNGENPNIVQLIDVPRQAPVKKGDTIITGGKSLIFPEGIPIGQIENFELDQSQSYYTIDVKLFNDMTNIGYVYVIENLDKENIQELEREDEQ
ncbi:rod shape-determining protein MreC [Salegentibacter sp. 24]|uniref:rod shape-determining protein MreC n=1 Tax=Salegentibacter sp. 24 TaxID=2183986 RepID=UPI00105FBC33|nr:rod shape-determining protein MreC [Salegentibacter sp. 24]TDN95341.1 rod shape-determining protein MreC [Salegentibacter sp. 24]